MGVVVNPQIVILYDANGVALAVRDGVAIPANTPAIIAAGSDGTNARYMRTATDGTVRVDPTGTTTQPISAASLPLPTGAAQEHATAASPHSVRLSDGAAFYDATKTGQLPSALTGSGNLKAALVEFTAPIPAGSNTIGKADQGAPNTAGNRWPVQHTDGTNFLPTMDAVGRAGFFKLTDGTNTAPTMDAAGRAGFVKITDGTNVLGTLFNTFHADPNGDRRTIHNNATLTTSGSTVVTWNGWSEWYLIINIKNAPTGTSPTITFTVEQLDPVDQTTIITSGAPDVKSDTSGPLTAAGVTILEITELVSDTVKISWTITGAAASFTGVNVSWCGHGAGNAVEGQAEEGQTLHDGPLPVAGVDSGNLVRTLKVDSAGRLIVAPSGSGVTNGFIYGDVALSSILTATPIRRTTYTEPASDAQRSVSSSSALDTSAGTGARQVKITYYDSTGAGPNTETVTLNGLTAVNTVNTNICFIEKIEVVSVGSTGSNAGIITLFGSTGGLGGTVGTIAATDNRTFWCHHYVPNGKTAFITSCSNTVNGGAATFFLKAKTLNVATAVEAQISDTLRESAQSATTTRNYGTPIQVTGPARIIGYVTTEAGTSLVYRSAFDFYEQ